MMCWCDDCCHNRDYECQLGADISISADHECNDFVDYIDTPMYKEKFWRMVEHFGRKYKREDCGKREKENGIVFFHLSKELMELVTTRLHMCPISFLKGQKKDTAYCLKHKCSLCFNDWLNEESEG